MSVTNTLLNETQPVEQQQEAYRSDHRTRLSSIPVPRTPWERRGNAVGTPALTFQNKHDLTFQRLPATK